MSLRLPFGNTGGDRETSDTARAVARWIGAAALALLVALGAYVFHLHREIEATWERHRTRAPSRVFAAPTPLYPGRDLSRSEVEEELRALGYRRVAERSSAAGDTSGAAPVRPSAAPSAEGSAPEGARSDRPPVAGQYRTTGGGLVVHLHDFDFPAPRGSFDGFPLRLAFEDGRIRRLVDLRSGDSILHVELEPRQIATLLDARMVRREPVPLAKLPIELVQAVLAVEDRRYFEHAGLDLRRIAGAALENLRSGRLAQGGSTLTQQLVKNYYLTPEKTFTRKLREAIMAGLLELSHDKAEILEAYLSAVYLGQAGFTGIVGVGPASRHYFSRSVSELDLPEAALLAGMIRAPNRYDPVEHPEAARRRRNLVLRLMHEQGRISAEEEERARSAPLPDSSGRRPVNTAPYFVDLVERELRSRYSTEALQQEGLRIFTTLDPRAQAAAETAVQEGLAVLEEEHADLRRSGDGPPLQAAFVAMDPRTGDILALVGGRSFRSTQFNRAIQANRQPGSLFKPFVYLTALADPVADWTLATRIPDTTFSVPVEEGTWSPSNYDGREHGRVTLREALEESYNVATARLALEVGLDRVIGTARRLGLSGNLRPLPSLALGAFEVTPLGMASAYSSLAGGGVRPEPLSVLTVASPTGEPLEARELSMERVAPPGPVYLVNRALQGVLERGTAVRAGRLGYRGPAAGKTGTTSGYRDAWFVGYTPELVALAWVGFDDNRSLGLPGAAAALPLWVRFMRSYGRGTSADFRQPPGVVEVAVEARSTGVEDDCRPEYFLEGTEPDDECGGWWIF